MFTYLYNSLFHCYKLNTLFQVNQMFDCALRIGVRTVWAYHQDIIDMQIWAGPFSQRNKTNKQTQNKNKTKQTKQNEAKTKTKHKQKTSTKTL